MQVQPVPDKPEKFKHVAVAALNFGRGIRRIQA